MHQRFSVVVEIGNGRVAMFSSHCCILTSPIRTDSFVILVERSSLAVFQAEGNQPWTDSWESEERSRGRKRAFGFWCSWNVNLEEGLGEGLWSLLVPLPVGYLIFAQLGGPYTQNFPDISAIPHPSTASGQKLDKCFGKSGCMAHHVSSAYFALK